MELSSSEISNTIIVMGFLLVAQVVQINMKAPLDLSCEIVMPLRLLLNNCSDTIDFHSGSNENYSDTINLCSGSNPDPPIILSENSSARSLSLWVLLSRSQSRSTTTKKRPSRVHRAMLQQTAVAKKLPESMKATVPVAWTFEVADAADRDWGGLLEQNGGVAGSALCLRWQSNVADARGLRGQAGA